MTYKVPRFTITNNKEKKEVGEYSVPINDIKEILLNFKE